MMSSPLSARPNVIFLHRGRIDGQEPRIGHALVLGMGGGCLTNFVLNHLREILANFFDHAPVPWRKVRRCATQGDKPSYCCPPICQHNCSLGVDPRRLWSPMRCLETLCPLTTKQLSYIYMRRCNTNFLPAPPTNSSSLCSNALTCCCPRSWLASACRGEGRVGAGRIGAARFAPVQSTHRHYW